MTTAKYLNIFTDFGFKKIFGEEANKGLLIDFLNAVLELESPIADLTFRNTEQLGSHDDRKVVYDLYCESQAGERFIVEMQKAKQNFFRERTIYYSTFPIRDQAEKGAWNYKFNGVFCIGILDFMFSRPGGDVVHEIKLRYATGEVFYNGLSYIYLEMPNFDKTEDKLTSRLDKWLYFMKNLEDFEAIPQIFKDEVVFIEALEKAELAHLSRQEMEAYEATLKPYRDLHGALQTAASDGEIRGEARGKAIGEVIGKAIGETEGIRKVAKAMKDAGADLEFISKTTGLSKEEIMAI